VIDDGSTDGTGAVADRLAAAIRRSAPSITPTHGAGVLLPAGRGRGRKNFYVYIPGDNTWPYRSLLELFGNLGKADVVTSYTTTPTFAPGPPVVSAMYTRALNVLFGRRMRYYNG